MLAHSSNKCTVTAVSLNGDASICAAVVKTSPTGSSDSYYLVAWVLRSTEEGAYVTAADNYSPSRGNNDQDNGDDQDNWLCMGCADMGSIGGSAASAATIDAAVAGGSSGTTTSLNIDWSPSGALLVVTSMEGVSAIPHALTNSTGLLKINVISQTILCTPGALQQHWDASSHILQSPLGKVLFLRAQPHAVDDVYLGPLSHVIVSSESRVMMVAIAERYSENAARVVWSDVRNNIFTLKYPRFNVSSSKTFYICCLSLPFILMSRKCAYAPVPLRWTASTPCTSCWDELLVLFLLSHVMRTLCTLASSIGRWSPRPNHCRRPDRLPTALHGARKQPEHQE